MLIGLIDIVQWLAGVFEAPVETIERSLWGGLLAGLVFASIHLVTMFMTRWGDGHPTSKSLIFSILVHLSCAFGVVAVSPPPLRHKPDAAQERTVLHSVVIEADEQVRKETSGNTPIWEQLPSAPDQELVRIDQSQMEFLPLESPERDLDELPTPPVIDLPDLASVPDQLVVAPQAQRSSQAPVYNQAVISKKVDAETAEAQPEVAVPSLSIARQRIERSGLLDPTVVERTTTAGAVERVKPTFDRPREMAAIDAPLDVSAYLKRDSETQAIRRNSGPVPPTMPSPEPGTETETPAEPGSSGSVTTPQFTRLPSRTPPNRADEGSLQEFRPERTPGTMQAEPEPLLAVRDSIRTPVPIDGVVPNALRPNFEAVRPGNKTSVPATYRLRTTTERDEVARKYGGTEQSERAVENSLNWLALHQNPEGFWDADGFAAQCPGNDRCRGFSGLVGIDEEGIDRKNAGLKADSGVTALSLLAFLGAGYTNEEGRHADVVDRAVNWLIRQQSTNGYLGGPATRYAQMYCHAMATYALAEASGMQSDPSSNSRLREAVIRGVTYIAEQQNPQDGGWRYVKGQRGDMSMFGWQLMALKSAEIAGIPMPAETKRKMVQFLKERSLGEHNGLATYRITDPPMAPTPSMTAEALFCKQMLGLKRSNPASPEAVAFLKRHVPKRSETNLYYWYYGTMAMYQYGGQSWQEWNERLREILVEDQVTTGHAAGSWDPTGRWGPYGGRVYSTAVATLCLEVYYRFLPLYRNGGQYTEE